QRRRLRCGRRCALALARRAVGTPRIPGWEGHHRDRGDARARRRHRDVWGVAALSRRDLVSIRGKSLLAAIGAVLAAASINVGCLLPNSPMCSNGTVCPVGGACDEANGVCFTPAELAACTGVAEGGDCVLSEVLGTCGSGGCRLGHSVWSVTAATGGGPVWE